MRYVEENRITELLCPHCGAQLTGAFRTLARGPLYMQFGRLRYKTNEMDITKEKNDTFVVVCESCNQVHESTGHVVDLGLPESLEYPELKKLVHETESLDPLYTVDDIVVPTKEDLK